MWTAPVLSDIPARDLLRGAEWSRVINNELQFLTYSYEMANRLNFADHETSM